MATKTKTMQENLNKLALDFEIALYEKALRENPNNIEALSSLGNIYTKVGRFKDGLKIDRKLCILCPKDPICHYNLACSYSLLNHKRLAIRVLKYAIYNLGYKDFDHMSKDPDLNNIRKEKSFKKLLEECSGKV